MSQKLSPFLLKAKEYFTLSAKTSLSGGSNIKLGQMTYTIRQFTKKLIDSQDPLADYIGKAEFFSKIGELMTINKCSDIDVLTNLSETIYGSIQEELKQQARDRTTGNVSLSAHGYRYNNKMPIIDRKSKARLIFDNDRKCIDYQSSYDAWKEYRSFQSKEIKELMSMGLVVADIDYDPYSDVKADLREVNGQDDTLTINAHIMPKWRDTEIENPILPPMFDKFMNHLFMDEESRDYVLHWLHFMLVDRNHAILLLHGGRGVGKGSFYAICQKLVGFENFGLIPTGFFDSRFNGELKYRRLVCFDDYPIKREYMNEWKQLPEPHLAIEDKGADVMTYKNHASYLVTNNTEAEVALLGDERKFSVPKIPTTGKIDDALGKDAFEEFMSSINDDEEVIANIGWWLIKNGNQKRYDNRRPFISDTFYEIVEKALTNWQRGVINEIERKESSEINLAHIEDITRGTGRTKIEKFLNVHRDRDGNLYGYIKQLKGGERVIVPSKPYMPENVEVTTEAPSDVSIEDLNF